MLNEMMKRAEEFRGEDFTSRDECDSNYTEFDPAFVLKTGY
jgi:hypothetical protein